MSYFMEEYAPYDHLNALPEDTWPEPPEDEAEQDSIDVQERREEAENGPQA